MNTKLLTIFLSLGLMGTAPLTHADDHKSKHKSKHKSDDRHDLSDHDASGGSYSDLRAEVMHTRGTYNQVLDDLDTYRASKHIRDEMRHINAELDHVEAALNSGRYDIDHVRSENAHIHDELHHVDQELHERGRRDAGGREGVRIQFPSWR